MVDAGDAVVEEVRDPPLLVLGRIGDGQVRVSLGVEVLDRTRDCFGIDLILCWLRSQTVVKEPRVDATAWSEPDEEARECNAGA